jgi:hypothetical protein
MAYLPVEYWMWLRDFWFEGRQHGTVGEREDLLVALGIKIGAYAKGGRRWGLDALAPAMCSLKPLTFSVSLPASDLLGRSI